LPRWIGCGGQGAERGDDGIVAARDGAHGAVTGSTPAIERRRETPKVSITDCATV
jgi:hypothetical protein